MFFYAAACIKTQIRFLDNDVTFVTICLLSRSSPVALVTVMLNVHINHIRFFRDAGYHWRVSPQVSFLSRQMFCRDKHSFVTTKDAYSRDNKSMQNYVCGDKYLSFLCVCC